MWSFIVYVMANMYENLMNANDFLGIRRVGIKNYQRSVTYRTNIPFVKSMIAPVQPKFSGFCYQSCHIIYQG